MPYHVRFFLMEETTDNVKDKNILKKLTFEMMTVIGAGIVAVVVDRVFQLSELLVRR